MMGIALDKLPHSGGAFPLHFVRHIVVDIQGKGGSGVAQVPLHGLDVISGADRRNCVGMPLWHNKDKSENHCGAMGWLVCPNSFSTNFPAKNRHNEGCQKVRCTIKDTENAYYPAGVSASRLGAFYQQGIGRWAVPFGSTSKPTQADRRGPVRAPCNPG